MNNDFHQAESAQRTGTTNKKKSKNILRLILWLIITVLLIFIVMFAASKLIKPKYQILSTKGSSEIIVYLPKNDVSAKNIVSLINQVEKDIAKIPTGANQNSIYMIKVFDDKTIAQSIIDHSVFNGLSKKTPAEAKVLMIQAQKDQQEHLILMTNNLNKWQLVYGPNYQALKNPAK